MADSHSHFPIAQRLRWEAIPSEDEVRLRATINVRTVSGCLLTQKVNPRREVAQLSVLSYRKGQHPATCTSSKVLSARKGQTSYQGSMDV